MAETGPTAEIARKVCDEIFGNFFWDVHPRIDANFKCTNEHHRTPTDKPKKTHPADVVFSYVDPYLNQRTYLLTDMKSYATDSISSSMLRGGSEVNVHVCGMCSDFIRMASDLFYN